MKGVAAIQEAALVKATNLNTAAQGKNIIVTKAATVAQAAFNLVAKANPYVLLAMALVTVVGALALFAKGSSKAAEEQKNYWNMKRNIESISNIVPNYLQTTLMRI